MVFFAWGLLGPSLDGQRFHADDRALKVLHRSTEVVEHLPRAMSSVVREPEKEPQVCKTASRTPASNFVEALG